MEERIETNTNRIGNFTSSQIWKLMTNGKAAGTLGKPALTYIQEKNWERKLGQRIESDSFARPTTWGQLVEGFAFQQLGMEYRLQSQKTNAHQDYPCWKGSADCIKFGLFEAVVDIKCPFTKKSYCQFNDITSVDGLRSDHPDGEAYYWQLVSNAAINNVKHAELIVFMPFQSQLDEIRNLTNYAPEGEIYKYFWIANSHDADLPYLLDGGYYNNIHIIDFEIPQADIDALTERVAMCSKLLINI